MIERIGTYTVDRELGRGGMGVVYAGRAPAGDPVAIKVLLDAGADVELRLRFETEVAACAKLRHPRVVRMLDAGREQGRPFLVMELLDGVSLDERLRRGDPLPVAKAVQLVAQLAEALETVHQSGILHRDLKPSNVMLTSRGPVITDFGLARDPAAERERITVSGEMLGTPAYMAPEQARGERHALGAATDVYGLGVILYQCLTGRTPFLGTQLQVLTQVLEAEPERPSHMHPEVDRELEAIVMRCLAKRAEDRFPSAGALGAALEDYALTWGATSPQPARGKLVVGLLVAIGLGLVTVWGWRVSRPAPVEAPPTDRAEASTAPSPIDSIPTTSEAPVPQPSTSAALPAEVQARSLFQQRKRTQALAALRQIPPQQWRPETWLLLGQIERVRGEIDRDLEAIERARAAFQEVLKQGPANLEALQGLVELRPRSSTFRHWEQRLLALARDTPAREVAKGQAILQTLGGLEPKERVAAVESAARLFQSALEGEPACREAWSGWLATFRALAKLPGPAPRGLVEELLACEQRLTAALPEDARLLHEAGVSLNRLYREGKGGERGQNLLSRAIELWTRALELEPGLGMAYRFRGTTRWELLRLQTPPGSRPSAQGSQEVLRDLKEACAKERTSSAYRELVRVLAAQRRVQEAEAALTQGLELASGRNKSNLLRVRSGLREVLGEPALALEDLRAAGLLEMPHLRTTIRVLKLRVTAIDESRQLLEARSWKDALKRLAELKETRREQGVGVYLLRGLIYADRHAYLEDPRDRARAIKAFRLVIERGASDHREAHVRYALLEPSRAEEAAKFAPTGSNTLKALAEVSRARRTLFVREVTLAALKRTYQQLIKAIRLDPNCVEAWATFLRVVGAFFAAKSAGHDVAGKAIDWVASEVTKRPKLRASPLVLSRLGLARQCQAMVSKLPKHWEEAERWFTAALVEPRLLFALRLRGQVRMALERAPQAVLDFTEAARLKPDAAFVLEDLGEAQIATRDYAAAEKSLTRSIEKWPKRARGYALRVNAWAGLKQPQKAAQDLAESNRLSRAPR